MKPENNGIEITTAIDKTIDCYGGDQVFIPAGTVGVLINVIIEDGKVMFLLDTDYGCEWFSSTEVEEKC